MKKVILIFTLMLLFSSRVFADIKFYGMNKEQWDVLDKEAHITRAYLQGVFDGLISGGDFKIAGVEINGEISVVQYREAITKLYSDYRNALIPVPPLLVVISKQLSGESEEEVEKYLQHIRGIYISKLDK